MSELKTVFYRTDIDSPSGYSRAARSHVKALLGQGVEVWVEPSKHDSTTIVPDDYWRRTMPVVLNPARPDGPGIRIWHETPEFFRPDPRDINIFATAWETSRIPDIDLDDNPRLNWVKQMNWMDAGFTFSQCAKRAFVDSGVIKPIHVIPHPIDLEMYKPSNRGSIADQFGNVQPDGRMVFLAVFQWVRRKNPSDLVTAFYHAFHGQSDVVLVIKTYGSSFADTQNITVLMQNLKKNMRLPHPPQIQMLYTHIPEEDIPKLYNSSDVHVTTSFGEGFGLGASESMACGKPVIFPNASSYPDFLDEEVGYPVETDPEPVHGMGHIPWYNATQLWWKVRHPYLVQAFRKAYDDWKSGKLQEKGMLARQRAEELFSYDRVGKMMVERLEALNKLREQV